MEGVEKFLKEQFIPKVVEDKQGIKCLFQHKDKLVEDGVVFFEFAKKSWSKKPIMNKKQFVIVDADMTDVLTFLNTYYNLSEDDFPNVRKVIIDMAMTHLDKFFGGED
jgi:hypothetical protein